MTITGFVKQKGYYIDKQTIDSTELKSIKDDLTVEPKLMDFGPENDENDEDEKNTLLTNMTTKIQQEQNKKVKANNNTNNQSTQTQLDDLARP